MTTTAMSDSNQTNFHPSWMKVVPAVTPTQIQHEEGDESPVADEAIHKIDIAEPIFAKNRYGREDLLALMNENAPVPEGLEKCRFFKAEIQSPICLVPLSETEARLQHNVNSSKAMNSLSPADRETVIAGGTLTQASSSSSAVQGGGSQPFTPTWMLPTGGGGRGSAQSGRGAYGSSFRNARGGGHAPASNSTGGTNDSTAKYVAARGRRGGMMGARGGNNMNATPFNARAQGLYDPRDPRDRPRQHLRSISDDSSQVPFGTVSKSPSNAPHNGGWAQVVRSHQHDAWGTGNKTAVMSQHSVSSPVQHNSSDPITSTSESLPEWMDDSGEKGSSANSASGGVFDEKSRYKTSNATPPTPNIHLQSASTRATSLNLADESSKPQVVMRPAPPPQTATAAFGGISEEFVREDTTTVERLTKMASAMSTVPAVPSQSPSQIPQMNAGSESVDEWFYLDPKNDLQGPFSSTHMEVWYNSGYFTASLKVCNKRDRRFVTLGDLIRENGPTPFRSKSQIVNPVRMPVQPQPQLTRNIWEEDATTASVLEAARVEMQRKKLEAEQARVLEAKLLLEKESEERATRERLIVEKELQLKKQEEELARQAAAEKERAALREKEIEEEKRRIAEELENAKRIELEKLRAERKKVEEEQKMMKAQLLAEQKERERLEKLRLEEERRRIEAEHQVEAERRAKEEERARMMREHEKREEDIKGWTDKSEKKRLISANDCGKKAQVNNGKECLSLKSTSERRSRDEGIVVTEEFDRAQKPKSYSSVPSGVSFSTTYRVVNGKPVSPKVAPWSVSVTDKTTEGEKAERSILEIQEEEKRRCISEKTPAAAVTSFVGGVWGSTPSSRLSWNQGSHATDDKQSTASRGVAWGGTTIVSNRPPASNPFWDGPSLDASNAAKLQKKSGAIVKSQHSDRNFMHEKSRKVTDPSSAEKEAIHKLFQMNADEDPFTNWVVQRIKQLNSQVDADILASFIEGVDSPNEVEDYVISYLGEDRKVKDFIRDFLEKRREFRSKKHPNDKDDLSRAAAAADPVSQSNSSVQNASGGRKKKKSNKGSKLIVDGACLGFRGTADSNRVNIGEIDTVTLGANPTWR